MSDRILPRDFYVYVHRRANGAIFYVGKGSGDRAWTGDKRTDHWKNIVKKSGLVVEIAQDGLQEWAAFELERDLIALHGRKDLCLGSLVNKTDGGEGSSGTIHSAETKAKIGAAHKGKIISQEHRAKVSAMNKGKKSHSHNSETREKISLALKGKTHTVETRYKMSQAQKGRTHSAKTRAKLSAEKKGKPRKDSTRVYIEELKTSFLTISLAHQYLFDIGVKIGYKSVHNATKSNRSCKGYTFSAYS